jgi:hypothetical protein
MSEKFTLYRRHRPMHRAARRKEAFRGKDPDKKLPDPGIPRTDLRLFRHGRSAALSALPASGRGRRARGAVDGSLALQFFSAHR